MQNEIKVEELEKRSGTPVERWAGNCYGMATAIIETGLAEGRAVYGHYRGPVHEDSMFYRVSSTGFVQHGWVLSDEGLIVDPTRWVFECKEPYIFIGGREVKGEYDEGGNVERRQRMKPPPAYDPNDRQADINFSDEVEEVVRPMLGHPEGPYSLTQIFWLANLPIDALAPVTEGVYEAIYEFNKALLPLDNRKRVLSKK